MRVRRDTMVAGIAVLLSSCGPDRAPAQTVDEAIAASRAIIEAYLADSPTPGLSIAVHLADSLVWAEGFGLASVELDVPVTTETKFRIGSISKSLTSAAVGLLVERGLLELDAPVQTYVPDFPEKTHPITTRQLAGHQSGIPHYGSEDFQNFEPYEGVFHALDKFKTRELLFVPGERFEYSSFGFNLVSAVVQGASGRQFVDFMHDEVFEPLGMPNTVPDDYRMIVANRTGFYEPLEGGAVGNAPFTDNSDVWAGGGYLSTPTDLARFGRGLLEGELLATETVELLWTAQRTTGGEETPYGIGWFVRTNDADEKVVSHGGAHFGASAQLVILPSRRLIVAITANMSGANVGERLGQILELFEALASPASGS